MALPIKVEVLTDVEALEQRRSAWDDLAQACGALPFAFPFWSLAWWRHFGRGTLHVITAESDGSLVGLAPFHRRERAGFSVLRFLGTGIGTVNELLVAPGQDEAAEAIWSEALKGRNLADLVEYRDGGGGMAALRHRPAGTWSASIRDICPVVRVRGTTFDDFMRSRGSRLRRSLSRADRFAEEEGTPVRAEVVTRVDELERALPTLSAIYDVAEAANPRAHFLRGPLEPFTRAVLRAAAEEERLAIFIVHFGDRPVACATTMLGGGPLSYSAPRFDPEFRKYSPGHLVLREIVRHAASLDRDVDLLLGDFEYKWQWTDDSYDTLTVRAAATPAIRTAATAAEDVVARAHHLLRRVRT